ncbi:unnamed protein product [Ambrosiozyma monospora]|uniref:Unnamed protein product n=1 Tax=Ambrosiozyma monospora TaxID=43982 RepID=A0ACB5UC53_AMBMO|nr:unnamed protein product [Ambrosiozyma monospora]
MNQAEARINRSLLTRHDEVSAAVSNHLRLDLHLLPDTSNSAKGRFYDDSFKNWPLNFVPLQKYIKSMSVYVGDDGDRFNIETLNQYSNLESLILDYEKSVKDCRIYGMKTRLLELMDLLI